MHWGLESAPTPLKQIVCKRQVVHRVNAAGAKVDGYTQHSFSSNSIDMKEKDDVGTSSDGGELEGQTTLQGTGQDVTVPLFDIDKNNIGSYTLPGDIFDVPIRIDILHRVVRWQLARKQQGTHKTKTRSEVRGGGRKPWKQKGTGRARQGTIRAVQWRGGGVVHGPVVRSHAHKLQRRVRRLGLKCALSAKASEGRLMVIDSLKPETIKTKEMDNHIENLMKEAPRKSLLFVDTDKQGEDGGEDLRTSIRNIPWVDAIPAPGLNVYSILRRDYLVMSKDAVDATVERLRRPIKPCSLTP
eukprot:jgi/Picsp_1/5340/NSC_02701-R1_50s ribosomal protein l4